MGEKGELMPRKNGEKKQTPHHQKEAGESPETDAGSRRQTERRFNFKHHNSINTIPLQAAITAGMY